MSVTDWSPQPSGNALADPDIKAARDGSAARDLPTSFRALMAKLAAQALDQSGALSSAGTGNIYTITTNSGFAEMKPGVAVSFTADRANTAAPVLSVDGTPPRQWIDADGAAFEAGDIKSGQIYSVAWIASGPGGLPAWKTFATVPASVDKTIGSLGNLALINAPPAGKKTVELGDGSDLSLVTRPLFDAANRPASTSFVAEQMSYITAFPSPQAAINASAATGRIIVIPAGHRVGLTAPLIWRNGACIMGERSTPDPNVGLVGCTIAADVPMASLITQADLTVSVRNARICGLTLDASKNVTGVAIDVAMISSDITDNVIQGPGYTTATTGLRQRTPTGGFGWINHISRNRIGGFGTGLNFNGSDSWITENYISGNLVNVIMNSTGSNVVANNQIENSGGPDANGNYTGVGLRLVNTVSGATDRFSSVLVTGNNFISHGTAIDIPDGPVAGFRSSHTIAANNFNDARQRAIYIGANNNNGSVWANTFAEIAATGQGAMVWNGIGNSGWKVGPNSFSGTFNPNPIKYVNLPPDTILIDEVLKNRQVVIDNGGFGYGSNAPLAVFGNQTVLGAANALARFSVAQNAGGFDAALLVRAINGSTVALDFRDGEQTQVADGLLMMNGQELMRLVRGGYLGFPNLPTSPTNIPTGKNIVWRDIANGNVLKVVP